MLAALHRQLNYFRDRHFGKLSFPPVLEEQYEQDLGDERALRMSREGLLIVVVYNLFLISDYIAMPHRLWLAALVRSLGITPVALLVCGIMRYKPSRVVREGAVVLLSGLAALCDMVLYHHVSDGVSTFAPISFMLILLVSNVVMRLQFPFAVATTIFCNITSILFLLDDPFLERMEKVHLGGLIFWGGIFILIANYSLEREVRFRYLLQQSLGEQAKLLEEANQELRIRSTHDGLTHLYNRSTFDQRLVEMWEESCNSRAPLSAVMIDIDHFKVVNDTQGHLYGDEVIKRVAALIRQALRGKHDFAARFGGEEFVLLLPRTDLAAAVKVAERVRTLVQTAGSPAPAQPVPRPEVGLWTTVSCGVATLMDANAVDYRRLVLAADTALYAAKAQGRNRVCAAHLLGVPEKQLKS